MATSRTQDQVRFLNMQGGYFRPSKKSLLLNYQYEKKPAEATSLSLTARYQAPQRGLLSYFPAAWVPYAELARIDKSAGFLYLYFPCLFGTCLAALISHNPVAPKQFLFTNLVFILGSFLVRCAGCIWNDIVDQDLDRHVSRTQLRPMARRAKPTSHAFIFTVAQFFPGLWSVYLLLPMTCLTYCIPSILLTALYPFAKRFTYYPQVVLGFVFSWGVIMAFPALGIDLLASSMKTMAAVGSLYVSCVAWTLVYDTIYAAQDIRDDVKAHIMSPVVLHRDQTRRFLGATALLQVVLLWSTGHAMEASPVFFSSTCFLTALILVKMVASVDLEDSKNCLWWFKQGCFWVGLTISGGFVMEYIVRYHG